MNARERNRRPTGRLGLLTTVLVAAALIVPATASWAASSPASGDPRGIRTPADPVYTLDLTSDKDGFVWSGTEKVAFTNVGTVPLDMVWIRLWDNGLTGCAKPLPIKVSKVKGGKAGDLDVDCTALPVTLKTPLQQNDTATLSFKVTITTPNTNWRFGRIGKMALVGNAIPVLAIHDALGWHLEPYTENGESFYSQIGDFTVTFTTPKKLKIPATGTVTSSTVSGKTRTTTIEADDVRDFAWASGPLSEVEGPASTGVLVKVWWTDPISETQANNMLSLSKLAMAAHADRFGPYPYQEIDVVLGVFTRFGGMEYPQFVMTDAGSTPLVHELGHQWWFGMVGDDQYTEPWLDEAFATYATDLYFGNDGNGCDLQQFPADDARITNPMAYWNVHQGWYGQVVYSIGSCALHALGDALGLDEMATFIHGYAVEHALGWSTTDAFKVEVQAFANTLPNPVNLKKFWKKWRISDVP